MDAKLNKISERFRRLKPEASRNKNYGLGAFIDFYGFNLHQYLENSAKIFLAKLFMQGKKNSLNEKKNYDFDFQPHVL